eukprot:SAG31_NODE_5874_length_2279_cov_4.474312_2_plen_102_part_00
MRCFVVGMLQPEALCIGCGVGGYDVVFVGGWVQDDYAFGSTQYKFTESTGRYMNSAIMSEIGDNQLFQYEVEIIVFYNSDGRNCRTVQILRYDSGYGLFRL